MKVTVLALRADGANEVETVLAIMAIEPVVSLAGTFAFLSDLGVRQQDVVRRTE